MESERAENALPVFISEIFCVEKQILKVKCPLEPYQFCKHSQMQC